ncbi:MAG: DUF2007 domain-containing protein [Xanthomonadaceae bacterium]|jgi:hypothetical protein|nr:DUF2007 domain-containing protein [Xanthomonadaceae bacterium]
MQVAYRTDNLFDAHLVKHLLEGADIPAFVFGESLLGGAGELPLFGVLRVCVPDPYLPQARATLVAAGKVVDSGKEKHGGEHGLDAQPI